MANTHKYKNPEDMQLLVDEYFKACDDKEEPYTVPGLAYALGFNSRQTLLNYQQMHGFSDVVDRAKLRIETQRAAQLVAGKVNVVGAIFDLKNNFQWKDKHEIEQTGRSTEQIPDADIEVFKEIARQASQKLLLRGQETATDPVEIEPHSLPVPRSQDGLSANMAGEGQLETINPEDLADYTVDA